VDDYSQLTSTEQQTGASDPELASHEAMLHVLWSRAFPRSNGWVAPAEFLAALQEIPEGSGRERAAYFLACQPFVDQLALQSPVEPELLGPYPFNPFPRDEWPQRFREAGFGEKPPDVLFQAGLQVASRRLLLEYLRVINEPMIRGQLEATTSDVILVDPLAGMMLWREGNRTRNQHLAWASVARWIGKSNKHPSIFKARGIQNEILSEGAISGRNLFGGILHSEAARAYERYEVAETIARDRAEFDRRIERLENAVAKAAGKYQLWFRGH
jgi:hypothetical protein